MGLSKTPKSLRYNFPAPVCGTYRFTSSQVDAVLDLSEIESASPFKFITQTFAVFCLEVACEARSNDARDAKRMAWGVRGRGEECGAEMRKQCVGCDVRGGEACGWGEGHSNGHARSMRRRDARGLSSAWLGQSGRIVCGAEMRRHNARVAKCAAWIVRTICKQRRRGAWGKGVGRCNGTCGAVRRGASGRRVLGAWAGA